MKKLPGAEKPTRDAREQKNHSHDKRAPAEAIECFRGGVRGLDHRCCPPAVSFSRS